MCETRLYDTTCFLLDVSSLFHYVNLVTTSLGAGAPSLPLLALGSMYVGTMIQFTGSWILFLDSLLFPVWLFGAIELINVASVLQEAVDTDSRDHTKSQLLLEYFIIHYTSKFLRLSHLYQEYHVYCIAITTGGEGVREGWGWWWWGYSWNSFYLRWY